MSDKFGSLHRYSNCSTGTLDVARCASLCCAVLCGYADHIAVLTDRCHGHSASRLFLVSSVDDTEHGQLLNVR